MDKTLQTIKNRIVNSFHPDKIIIFGSRAKGSAAGDSDYDICVLKRGTYGRRRLAQNIYTKLFGVGASVDVIVETPDKFEELKDKKFLIYYNIAKFGRTIYEKEVIS